MAKSRGSDRRTTRKPALGLDAILDVTIAIIDAEGVDAVSMRRVAAEFDTGPASLYAYVDNKQELLERVVDRVTEENTFPEGGTWQEMVRAWARDAREVFLRHQDVAKLAFAYIPHNNAVIDGAERMLAAMIGGGVPPQVAAWAMDVVSMYIAADAYEGWLLAQRFSVDPGRSAAEVAQETLAEIGTQFADLDPERYPFVTRYSSLLVAGDSDERFSFGIDMLIAGFEAQISGSS